MTLLLSFFLATCYLQFFAEALAQVRFLEVIIDGTRRHSLGSDRRPFHPDRAWICRTRAGGPLTRGERIRGDSYRARVVSHRLFHRQAKGASSEVGGEFVAEQQPSE